MTVACVALLGAVLWGFRMTGPGGTVLDALCCYLCLLTAIVFASAT